MMANDKLRPGAYIFFPIQNLFVWHEDVNDPVKLIHVLKSSNRSKTHTMQHQQENTAWIPPLPVSANRGQT